MIAMSDVSEEEAEMWVDAALETIEESWRLEDPYVIHLGGGDRDPVVAVVEGEEVEPWNELRVLHSGLVYPAAIDRDDIREYLRDTYEPADLANPPESEPPPRIARLSEFSHRFDRDDFEEDLRRYREADDE